MKIRYIITSVFVIFLQMVGVHTIFAQNESEQKITISSVVEDSNGNPVVNAEIYGGSNYTKTGSDGRFTISLNSDESLIVKAENYKSETLPAALAGKMMKIVLQPSEFLYDEKINLGFRQVYEGDLVGAVSFMTEADFDNDKSQIMGGTAVEDMAGYRMLGLLGGLNVRGLGIGMDVGSLLSGGSFSSPSMIVVDGMPRDLDFLRMSEIESITVLKDANAAVLYGTSAVNGVILITTKRTKEVRKQSDFTVQYGLSTPKALPKFLNSYDYMTYYNLAYNNDGNEEDFYDQEQLNNFKTGNKYRYPDIDYYSSEFLKPFKSFYDVNGEFVGGNQIAKYYSNFGVYSAGDMFKMGYGKEARNNVYNLRINLDVKPLDWIDIKTDGRVVVGSNKTPIANLNDPTVSYWDAIRNDRPNQFASLLPIELMDPEIPELLARKRDIDGKYLLGGDVNNRNSILGNMNLGGTMEESTRIFSFTNQIHVDLSSVTEGLSFNTNLSFNYAALWYQTLRNQYKVYYPTWDAETDRIIALQEYGKDYKESTPIVSNLYMRRSFGGYATLNYDRTFNDVHHFTGALLGYVNVFKMSGDYQGDKRAHVGFQLGYGYDKRYMVDFSGAYVNSTKLPVGNRGGLSPTVGLAWVVSNEEFMSGAGFVDYLKIRASAGIIRTDVPITEFYIYESRYGGAGSLTWNENLGAGTAYSSQRGYNPNLTFVDRKDINIGLQGVFLNKSLGFEANVFMITNEKLPTTAASRYPGFYGGFLPVENYNSVKYQGFETGLNYTRKFNNWTLSAGVNALYSVSTNTKLQEKEWAYDYQKREGRPADAYYGLVALGLFRNEEDVLNSPQQTFGSVKPGDIKYQKQNDEATVTVDDEVYLGRWQSPFVAGADINLSYKFISLMVIGEARAGSVSFTESNYYWMDGNERYSELAKDSWTEANWKTASFPRLTTGTAANNYRRSTFWMYKNDFFRIRRVQLTCKLPDSMTGKRMSVNSGELFLYATDPFLLSKSKEIMNLSNYGAPYYRSYVIGMKVSF